MKRHLAYFFISAILCSLTGYTALADTTGQEAVQALKSKLYEVINKDTVSITFAPNSSDLSESERRNLAAVVSAVRSDARASEAIIAAWSDKEYPATKGESLTSKQRRLADERASAVENALNGLGIDSVESHSMAERPSWLQKVFNTKDTKFKGEGKISDADDQLAMEIGRILEDKGGPGQVVVIIRRDGDYASH